MHVHTQMDSQMHTHTPPADVDAQSKIHRVLSSDMVFSGGTVKLKLLIENVK